MCSIGSSQLSEQSLLCQARNQAHRSRLEVHPTQGTWTCELDWLSLLSVHKRENSRDYAQAGEEVPNARVRLLFSGRRNTILVDRVMSKSVRTARQVAGGPASTMDWTAGRLIRLLRSGPAGRVAPGRRTCVSTADTGPKARRGHARGRAGQPIRGSDAVAAIAGLRLEKRWIAGTRLRSARTPARMTEDRPA